MKGELDRTEEVFFNMKADRSTGSTHAHAHYKYRTGWELDVGGSVVSRRSTVKTISEE